MNASQTLKSIIAALMLIGVVSTPMPTAAGQEKDSVQKSARKKTSKTSAANASQQHDAKKPVQQQKADNGQKRGNRTPAKRNPAPQLKPEQETKALKFADDHHAELAGLLRQLKEKSGPQYIRGIREVWLTAQRLERYRERQPERFEAEVSQWKCYSKIRLLTARYVLTKDEKLATTIQALLKSHQESKLQTAQKERDRIAARLKELDANIADQKKNFQNNLNLEWMRIRKKAEATARNRKRSDEPTTAAKNK